MGPARPEVKLTCAAQVMFCPWRRRFKFVTIQIRHVSDALHRRLKSRAALAGMSLSDYLLREIRQLADRQSMNCEPASSDTRA